jgi:hypothetical protein
VTRIKRDYSAIGVAAAWMLWLPAYFIALWLWYR